VRDPGKHRFASHCVVVDAAWIEPVFTPNSLLAGNLAGNFLKTGPSKAIQVLKSRAASITCKQIPCSTEQGIFLREQGILARKQGILEFWNFCADLRSLDPSAGRESASAARRVTRIQLGWSLLISSRVPTYGTFGPPIASQTTGEVFEERAPRTKELQTRSRIVGWRCCASSR
jgi:hypothetical protein